MSCCGVCSSLRGASYFITSIHIFIGLSLFLKWAIIVFIDGHHNDYFEDDRQQYLYPLLLCYITLSIVLGCINFLAVQKEAEKLMKWTTHFLLLLQIAELSSHLLLGFYFPDEENEDPAISRMWHLQRFGTGLLGSIPYFTILYLYSRQLTSGGSKKKKREFIDIEDRYYDPPTKEDKGRKKGKPANDEEEAALAMNPSAPPPTPGPSQKEDEEDEPEYIDADGGLDGNVYITGSDKKALRN